MKSLLPSSKDSHLHQQQQCRSRTLFKKLLLCAFYAFAPIAIFRLCFYTPSSLPSPSSDRSFIPSRSHLLSDDDGGIRVVTSTSLSSSPSSAFADLSFTPPPTPPLPSSSPPPPSLPPPSPPPPSPSPPPPPSPSPPPPPIEPPTSEVKDTPNQPPTIITTTTPTTTAISSTPPCDYTNGEWIPTKTGPLYNGTTCQTIKPGQNCMVHGRPDLDYLYWQWKPKNCNLHRFDPSNFLTLLRDKHLAFVGDSMARNQLESLICQLTSSYHATLLYSYGDEIKFRRWHFPSHNATISVYWSPFLVKGIEKSNTGTPYNRLFLDSVDEKWASQLGEIDIVVLSIGHWFLHPALYYQGKDENNTDLVFGCHVCDLMNSKDEVGFYHAFRKAYRTSLNAIVERQQSRGNGGGRVIDVVVTTIMPSHFEGEWDNVGACNKTKPYREGEVEVEGMNSDMRKIAIEELEDAKMKIGENVNNVRVQLLDVTKLSLLRPDGHPGPYMYANPFANGFRERAPNDCLHFCLPGPIDTWNEIMLDLIMKKQMNLESVRGK